MERARVAVCLAVRDGMPYLPVAVDSILAQTLWQLEILVVDDGSSDGTAAFLAGLADARVRVLTQPGAGLAAALNRCIDTVAADFIARMDADDIARPERLAEQLAFMAAHPDVAAAGSWIEYFADAGRRTLTRTLPTGHDAIVRALTHGGHGFCHPTLVIRTAAARQAGGYHVAGPGQMTQFALALARVGRLGEAAGATDRAAAIAGSLADDASPGLDDAKAEVLRLRASIARREGRHHEAVMLLERLLGEHPGAPPRVQRLVQDNLAWARHLAGDQPGALEAARRALELSAGGLERGWALRTLAVIGREALVSAERKEHLEQALAIARELGTFRLLASALTHLGDLQRAAGEPAQAMASFRQVVQVGSEHVDHDDHSSSLASLAMMLVDDRRGNEGAALLRGRKAGASSWERALGLVAAACAASLGDVDGAALEAMAIRAAEEELPTSWGVARAAEVLADAFRRSEREELAAWASAQAAHVTAHLGTSSEAARPESMPPDTSGEVTLEATRREVSYAGVYDRISRLRAALVERGEQRMLASIDRALDRGSPREAFAELRPVLLRAADTGRLDGATSQALVDALRAVDEALAR